MKPRPDPLTFQGKISAWKGAKVFTQSPFSGLAGDPGFRGNRNHSPKWGEGPEVKGQQQILKIFLHYVEISPSLTLSAGIFPSLLSHVRFLVADEI